MAFGSYGSVPDGLVGAVIDPFAQVLAGLEMGYVFAGQRHGLAGLGIAPLARGSKVQRETAEAPDLDALTLGQGVTHDLQDLLQCQLNILGGQMLLLGRDDFNQFRFGHRVPSLVMRTSVTAYRHPPRMSVCGWVGQLRSPICSFSRSPRLVPVVD